MFTFVSINVIVESRNHRNVHNVNTGIVRAKVSKSIRDDKYIKNTAVCIVWVMSI